MQLTALKTPGSIGGLYPDFVGKRSLFVGTGTGPASYATSGDPVTASVTPFYFDLLFGGVYDTTGVYVAFSFVKATGTRQQWYLRYFAESDGALTEVSADTNLSAIVFQLGGIGGQF